MKKLRRVTLCIPRVVCTTVLFVRYICEMSTRLNYRHNCQSFFTSTSRHSVIVVFSCRILRRNHGEITLKVIQPIQVPGPAGLLWPSCAADADIIFSTCSLFFLSSFSSLNLSRCRLAVYHTYTHDVALESGFTMHV